MKRIDGKRIFRGLLWGGAGFVATLLVIRALSVTVTTGSYATAAAVGFALFTYEIFFVERYGQRLGEIVRRILKMDSE